MFYVINNEQTGETRFISPENADKLSHLDEFLITDTIEECCGAYCSEAGCCPFNLNTNEQ